jgi:hypothetical protein
MTENSLIYTSLKTKYPSDFAAQQDLRDEGIDVTRESYISENYILNMTDPHLG